MTRINKAALMISRVRISSSFACLAARVVNERLAGAVEAPLDLRLSEMIVGSDAQTIAISPLIAVMGDAGCTEWNR